MNLDAKVLAYFFGSLLIAGLIVFTIAKTITGIRHKSLSDTFRITMLLVLLTDLITFLLPYALLVDNLVFSPEGFFKSIYAVAQAISIQAPLDEVTSLAHQTLDGRAPILAAFYSIEASLLAIATPLVVVTTAISSLQAFVQRLRLRLAPKRGRVAYIFSEISENQVMLARDIFKHHNQDRPLVLFCGVGESIKNEQSATIQTLREEAHGSVMFLPDRLSDAATKDTFSKNGRFTQVHVMALGDSREANIEEAISFIEKISEKAASSARENEDEAHVLVSHFHLYCTNESQEDDLIFDSLANSSIGGDDEYAKAVKVARKQLETRLISPEQERLYTALTRYPLFSVLDEHDGANTQRLYVLVVGLGRHGSEALKAVYWMGRMSDVSLHITAIDQRAEAVRKRMEVTCPEMLEERGADGEPVIEFVEAEAFSPEFVTSIKAVPKNAGVYALVMLGDDRLNLQTAISMRRTFEEMALCGKLDNSKREPMILPLIKAPGTFDAVSKMQSDSGEPFTITPFGKTEDVFSYRNIIEAPWERYSIAMNAAYDEVWDDRKENEGRLRGAEATMEYDKVLKNYNQFEIKKRSSRACTRHIPYRLWSIGINPGNCFTPDGTFQPENLTLDDWRKALDIKAEQADRLFDSHGESIKKMVSIHYECPNVSVLANLEHDRWLAFYRSEGWKDLTLDERDRLEEMGIITKQGVHQSPKLKRHCYMCDLDTLIERGAALKKDPLVYDRAAVIETQRILSGEIFDDA